MEVYRLALTFVRSAHALRQSLGAGRNALSDQLDRASISIPLNVAKERASLREKKRRGSIGWRGGRRRSAAMLDIIRELKLAEQSHVDDCPEQLRRIVAMLIALGKSVESRSNSP